MLIAVYKLLISYVELRHHLSMCVKLYIHLALQAMLFSLWIRWTCSGEKVEHLKLVADDTRRSSRSFTPSKCYNFTIGNPEIKAFYTPRYPNNYPNNTDCIRIIEAPASMVVQLDFRNQFHVEAESSSLKQLLCPYDFLEVRDGRMGYAPLLGHFCGDSPPPRLNSTGRYMWLIFHSDETIEYQGFHAVYTFLPSPYKESMRPMDDCVTVIEGKEEGYINNSTVHSYFVEFSKKYNVPLDCGWDIQVPVGYNIYLKLDYVKLLSDGNCHDNFLETYDGNTHVLRKKRHCSKLNNHHIKSVYNRLFVRLYSKPGSSFQGSFTMYRSGRCDLKMEFDCGGGICINKTLVCNGFVNCFMDWDERECPTTAPTASTTMESESGILTDPKVVYLIAGVAGGVAFVIIIIIAICCCCCRRRAQRGHLQDRGSLESAHRTAQQLTDMEGQYPGGASPLLPHGASVGMTELFDSSVSPNYAWHEMNSTSRVQMREDGSNNYHGKRDRPKSLPQQKGKKPREVADCNSFTEKPQPLPRSSSLKWSEKVLTGMPAAQRSRIEATDDDEPPLPYPRTTSLEQLRTTDIVGGVSLKPAPKPVIAPKPTTGLTRIDNKKAAEETKQSQSVFSEKCAGEKEKTNTPILEPKIIVIPGGKKRHSPHKSGSDSSKPCGYAASDSEIYESDPVLSERHSRQPRIIPQTNCALVYSDTESETGTKPIPQTVIQPYIGSDSGSNGKKSVDKKVPKHLNRRALIRAEAVQSDSDFSDIGMLPKDRLKKKPILKVGTRSDSSDSRDSASSSAQSSASAAVPSTTKQINEELKKMFQDPGDKTSNAKPTRSSKRGVLNIGASLDAIMDEHVQSVSDKKQRLQPQSSLPVLEVTPPTPGPETKNEKSSSVVTPPQPPPVDYDNT